MATVYKEAEDVADWLLWLTSLPEKVQETIAAGAAEQGFNKYNVFKEIGGVVENLGTMSGTVAQTCTTVKMGGLVTLIIINPFNRLHVG